MEIKICSALENDIGMFYFNCKSFPVLQDIVNKKSKRKKIIPSIK